MDQRVKAIPEHRVVAPAEWREARLALLAAEKEFTRRRDELTRQRQALPWTRVEKPYEFAGAAGPESLADLFQGRSQLIVYHFMFGPDWEAGCPSCSFWADQFAGVSPHLNARDTTLVAVSRAPLQRLQAYAKRLGWGFKWVSSGGSDFNFDFEVSFAEDGEGIYNYGPRKPPMANVSELHGFSVFAKDAAGTVFHTYSCYARGIDMLNPTYNLLDITPKGRDEATGPMAWLRRRDEYAA